MAIVISADEIKKTFPGYSPEKVEEFHQKSARQADKEFYLSLSSSSFKEVILMNGGTASGKTEFLATQLANRQSIIFDGTMSSSEGAKIKIHNIVKAGKKPIIYSIIPDDLWRAFIAFLNRDRKFSPEHFYRTHSGSRKTVLWVAENIPEVNINLIESSFTEDKRMNFRKLKFTDDIEFLQYLREFQMSEADIINSVNEKLIG